MAEAYTVQAQLNMRSNVPEVIAQMVRGFETLNGLVKETQANLSRFASDLRSLSSSTRGIGKLTESMEKLSSMKLGGGILADMKELTTSTREMQTAQAELARSAQQTATAYKELAEASRRVRMPGGGPGGLPGGGGAPGGPRQPGRGRKPATSNVSLVDAGMGLGIAGDAGAGFFERSIEAELEVQKLINSFRQNNLVSPADLATVRAKAESLVRSVPGTTVAENLHTIVDGFTIVGDLKEAMAGSETMAKLKLLYASMPGAKGRDPSFAANQAAEVMQRFYDPKTHQTDLVALNKQVNAMAVVAAGTGGRVGPDAYLAYAKQARLGGMVANDQFLYKDLPGLLIALGGSRTGTGEAATFQQFVTGTMTKNAAEALKKLGLLNKNAKWQGGRVQDMAHNFVGQDEYMANPIQWIRDKLLGPGGALAKSGIDPNDRVAVARALATFTSRQTGLGFLSEPAIGMAGIDKEANKIGNTNADPMAVIQANDPNAKVKAFQAAQNEFEVTVGQALLGPAIDSLKALTAALREMTDWAKANPNAAKDIALVAAGTTIFAKAAGDLAMVVFVGSPVVKGMMALAGALSPFSAGPAGTALGTLTAGAGVGSLGALALGVTGLGAAVVGTVAVMKGFGALNDALGIKPGKGDNGPASPHGNRFMDGLSNWWDRFSAPQPVNPHPNARGMPAKPAAYLVPPGGQAIQVHTALYLDKRQIGAAVTEHQTKELSGPSAGMTGFDIRAGFAGAMPA